MADETPIKYGDGVLKLKKSDTLIAVKPKAGTEARTLTSLAPELSDPENVQTVLGGFRLLSVKEAPGVDTNEMLDKLRAHGAVAVGTHVFETSEDGVPFVPTGQLYVECEAAAPDDQIQELFDAHKLEIVEARGAREFIVQVTPGSQNPIKTAASLQQSPLVKIAEPDLATPGAIKAFARPPGMARDFVLPPDELLKEQWHLENTGMHRGTRVGFKKGADARVVAAWRHAKTLGDPTVVVAVIDDGFDLKHPDLSGEGKIVSPMDFTRNSNEPVPDLLGEDWHGTACAGVAVGNADSKGIVGAAPQCRLMPVRWGRDLSDREIENWFGWVKEQGAWVVSCSWGAAAKVFRLSTRVSRAITRCAREGRQGLGCVICFAAGNDNHDINDPTGAFLDGFATHPDVIAVAACNSRDQRSNYSNYGKEISVCASSSGAGGWGITTADVMGHFLRGGIWFEAGYSPGAFTHDFGGTSSACPLVAGICGLLLSIKPSMKAAEVKQLMQRTARRIGDPTAYDASGHSPNYGYGCIDALAAVQQLLSPSSSSCRPGMPARSTVLTEKMLTPVRSSIEAHAAVANSPMTYRILRTSETDPYDAPLQPAEMATLGVERFARLGDTYRGQARKAAKLSIANAAVEDFEDVKDLIDTLPAEVAMIRHRPLITTDAESGRVNEENRNVRVQAFLYAASREDDNDFHLIVGRAPDREPMYMTMEISGLPPQRSRHFSRLKAARDTYKEFFGDDLPGASYDFYDPPIPIEVEGSLFFDMSHSSGSRPGPASLRSDIPTIWEIHPITDILFEP